MLRSHLLQLVKVAPALGVLAQVKRPRDPSAVGRGKLIEQSREISLPPQQLAKQPQPALMVATQERRTSLGEEQAVDMVVQLRPCRIAGLDPEEALEGLGEISGQGQSVPFGQENVLEVFDGLDAGAFHGEVADVGFLEQVNLDSAAGLVFLFLFGLLLQRRPELRGLAGQADVALERNLHLAALGTGLFRLPGLEGIE